MARIIDLREFPDTPGQRAARRARNSKSQKRTTTKNPAIHRPRSVTWASRERALRAARENREVTRFEGIDREREER
jgi:hypothetical protein